MSVSGAGVGRQVQLRMWGKEKKKTKGCNFLFIGDLGGACESERVQDMEVVMQTTMTPTPTSTAARMMVCEYLSRRVKLPPMQQPTSGVRLRIPRGA